MTRINLMPPQKLTDQHLLAEKKEINQLAGQFLKSLKSPNFNYNKLPKTFTLGTGHVRFFYPYGEFLRKRFKLVCDELVHRKFASEAEFKDVWKDMGPEYNLDYTPHEVYIDASKTRVLLRVMEKPDWYRLNRKPIKIDDYEKFLMQKEGN